MGNMLAFLGRDMAVDLGTANTLVYVRGRVSGRCPVRACGWHWHRQLPLDTRHPGHPERHEHDGDDDQADQDYGLLPSGDLG
jgi:hypothetical protein